MINVTKPFLPPIHEYEEFLKSIWERNWLTNNGPLVNELEIRLKTHLGLKHLLFVNNGTIALQLAYKALGLADEIITTPFSYVATTSSLVWENCTPVFVDIDPKTLNIDPSKIENKITEKTKGIVATHVFGRPCDVKEIEKIANRHNLKVVYDGAHCFGVKYDGRSILEFGDISTISFHATKNYHTIEGGAVITKDPDALKRLSLLRNFGHDGPGKFDGVGINAKNSEFHAAMGLCNLKYVDDIQNRNKMIATRYEQNLDVIKSIVETLYIQKSITYNYAYFPIIFETEKICVKVLQALANQKIFARRYFYPSLNSLNYVNHSNCEISESISKRILCLPSYVSLKDEDIDMITRIIIRTCKYE